MYLLTLLNHQGQSLAQYALQEGLSKHIQSVDNVYYQLVDESGVAPQGVQASRAGDDLLVQIGGEPVLVIEDYFLLDDAGLKNPLIAADSNGVMSAYPIDGNPVVLEHQLAGEIAADNAGAAGTPSLAILAGIAGIGVAGVVIASSHDDNKSQSSPPDNQPQTPFNPNQPVPPPADLPKPPPAADNGNIPTPPSGGNTTPPPPANRAPTDISLSAST
ncbi:MAG: hypothetical protein Q4A06_04165, partial [Cardiobacteriaceae bacterium]|nr:hypothetical protein [Cardiobacteriaceae bacterium]